MISFFKKVSLVVLFMFSSSIAQDHVPDLKNKKITLTLILNHPSLDLIVEGVMEELIKAGCDTDNIKIENAQGNIATAVQIAQKAAAEHPDLVVAISTPSAQTMQKALKGTNIPLVFGAVTDPIGAKLVDQLEKPGNLITGTIDLPSAHAQIDLIKKLTPSFKTIGLIYNPSESNNETQIKIFKQELHKQNIKFIEASVAKISDVKTAVLSILNDCDVIYIPNDNTMIAALPSLLKIAQQMRKPIYTSDPESVKKGALAALANDQKEIGCLTGRIAVKILKGTSPRSISINHVQPSQVYINEKVKNLLRL